MQSLDAFVSLLATIPDPRRAEGKLYELPYVLLFAICAVVSGANSYRGIETFIRVHLQGLNKAFKIRWKRAPAHTSIRYALQGLDGEDVEKAFREHAAGLNQAPKGEGARVIAFDGKVLKASFDNFKDAKAKQVLSAFAVDTGLVLAHIEIDEKSNEIPAMQTLLGELGVAGQIVTADAIHCQKKTFEAAAAARAHLIVQLKDNHPNLCQNVEAACAAAKPLSNVETVDGKRRNRHETRAVTVFDAKKAVAKTQWQPHVAAVIRVERSVDAFQPSTGLWKPSAETSYYLSSHKIDAQTAATAIRGHWAIENKSHYTRDVTLREDASRIRNNPGVFARIRSWAYNILRRNQSNSIPQTRYAAALGGLKPILEMVLSKER